MTTWRLVIGGIPDRSMADGMRLVLGGGDDVPPFLTFVVEEERDPASELGSLLAERDRLIAAGADPAELELPLPPEGRT